MSTTTTNVRFEPLNPSGFGAVVTFENGVPDAGAVRDTALARGVAVVRDLALDEESFRELISGMGHKITFEDENASVGYGYRDVLHLDGSSDSEKVVTGRGVLPLHNDGAMVHAFAGAPVDLIVLYAAELDCVGDDGTTVVCDIVAAWEHLPQDLRRVIDAGTLEYEALEKGFYTCLPEGWFAVPTVRNSGRVSSLNLAMPFPDGEPASWRVRVPGVSVEESDRFFAELDAFLNQDAYLYSHVWRPGDLLVIDNQRTLHGRTALAEGTTRKLLRGQVTLEASPAPE